MISSIFMLSKNWLKPATWVGSRVWSVISVLLKALSAAARTVVAGKRVRMLLRISGLNWFFDSEPGLSVL